jgi:hypothetical protein
LIIVGVGTPEESPIPRYGDDGKPLYDDHGERSYFLTDSGAMATTARDDTFLEQLKEETGGQLVKVTPGQPVSINWPNALAGSSVQIAKRDLYQYPLALGMAVLGSIWLSAFWSRILALLQQGRRRISRRS